MLRLTSLLLILLLTLVAPSTFSQQNIQDSQAPRIVAQKATRAKQVADIFLTVQATHPNSSDMITYAAVATSLKKVPNTIDNAHLFLWNSDVDKFLNANESFARSFFQNLQTTGSSVELIDLMNKRDSRFQDYVAKNSSHLESQDFLEMYRSILNVLTADMNDKAFSDIKIKFHEKNQTIKEIKQLITTTFPKNTKEFRERLALNLAQTTAIYQKVLPELSFEEGLLSSEKALQIQYASKLQEDKSYASFAIALSYVLQTFDPHTNFYSKEDGKILLDSFNLKNLLGISYTSYNNSQIVIAVIEDSPASIGGLKPGDVILEVNNNPTVNLSTSEISKIFDELYDNKIHIFPIKVKRGNQEIALLLNRNLESAKKISPLTLERHQIRNKSILKLDIKTFGNNFGKEALSLLENELHKQPVDGLLIDLRSNGGGLLNEVTLIARALQSKDQPLVWIGANDRLKISNSNIGSHSNLIPQSKVSFTKPIVVLVDNDTASASEILAGSLKIHGRAIVVGSKQTYGKGSVQTIENTLFFNSTSPMFDYVSSEVDGYFKHTVSLYYLADGSTPQLNGIASDIIIKGSSDDLEYIEKFHDNALSSKPLSEEQYSKYKDYFNPSKIEFISSVAKLSEERQKGWPELSGKENSERVLQEAQQILLDWIDLGGK